MGELMNEQETIIWAAGFIDGEGCISLIGDRGTYTAVINVGQVEARPLQILQSVLGGSIGFVRDRFGGHYQWRVYGQAAANAAIKLMPYLQNKAHQAEILIAYQETKGIQGQAISQDIQALRQHFYNEMKNLNAKRSLDAERLSEEAPLNEGDAIVRSCGKNNHKSAVETAAPAA